MVTREELENLPLRPDEYYSSKYTTPEEMTRFEKAENEKTRFKFTYTSEKDEKLELYDVVSFKDVSFYGASEDVFGNAYSYSEKVFLKLKGFSSFSSEEVRSSTFSIPRRCL